MTTAPRSEFIVAQAYRYSHKNTLRWLISHIGRYWWLALIALGLSVFTNVTFALAPVLIGKASAEILAPTTATALRDIALAIFATLLLSGIGDLAQSLSTETMAQRLETDTREELYTSLLGKSQTFHDQQRVGDIMARATEDVRQLNSMINPGVFFLFNTVIGVVVPIVDIALLDRRLLFVPIMFLLTYVLALRIYARQLAPVASRQREQFGKMNAGLEETISGIEVVKASAQEAAERKKFKTNAGLFRDFYVRQGEVESGYLPTLLFGLALAGSFLHAIILYTQGEIGIPVIVGFVGLLTLIRWPITSTLSSMELIQFGMAGARRILNIIRAEAGMDENNSGISQRIEGAITFDRVSFQYESQRPVLNNLSFSVQPGQTIAIVGQTGAGKTTLTQLVNRTYDVTRGSVQIDGIDVRQWNLNSLRAQISRIEQDIFLFSRTVSENIAFGKPDATQAEIEQAAHEAQAHDFIMGFAEGYQTMIGERGVTLSGGQRQRIALARAFLSNPRILILDDSTSAIDSATEDEIQKAIQRARLGRTTFLITHRLSQIRWADYILVLERGHLVASGTHDELLHHSPEYRRIFAHYDSALPPLIAEPESALLAAASIASD